MDKNGRIRDAYSLVWVGVCVFIGARLWSLGNLPLDGDEIFSLQLVRQSWMTVFEGAIADSTHPPLFYLLLKSWILLIGDSVTAIRILAVLASLGTLLVFLSVCRRLRLSSATIGLATLLIGANSFLITHHQWVRMYVFLEFWGICSIWMFLRFLDRDERWRWAWLSLTAVNLALIYTHYYGWLLLGIEGLFTLAVRRRVAMFSAHVAVVAMLFAPWAAAALDGAAAKGGLTNISWYSTPSLSHVATYYSELAGRVPIRWGARIGLILFFAPIALLTWRVFMERRTPQGSHTLVAGLLVMSFLPASISFGVSQVSEQSIWGSRHLINSAMPFLLLVSLGVMSIKTPIWRKVAVTVLVAWAVLAGIFGVTKDNRKLAWDVLAKAIAESEPGGPKDVYCLENFTCLPLSFYVKEHGYSDLAVYETRRIPSGVGRFWLVVRETEVEVRGMLAKSQLYTVGTPVTIEKQYTKVFAYPVLVRSSAVPTASAPGRLDMASSLSE